MTKTVCDITGTTPAERYRITKADGSIVFEIDLCAECAKKIVDNIESQITVTDIKSVLADKTNVQ